MSSSLRSKNTSSRGNHCSSNLDSFEDLGEGNCDNNGDSVSVASNVSIKWETETLPAVSSIGETKTSTSSYQNYNNHKKSGRRFVKKRVELDDLTVKLQEHHQREGGGGRTTKLLGICLLLALLSFSTVNVNHEGAAARTVAVSTRLGKKASIRHRDTVVVVEDEEQQDETLLHQQTSDDDLKTGQTTQQQQPYNLYRHLADITSPWKQTDVPFLLQIPRSGGSIVRDILGRCYGYTRATDDTIATVEASPSLLLDVIHSEDGSSHFNVDLSTPDGIERAQRMGLLEFAHDDELVMAAAANDNVVIISRGNNNSFTSIATGLFPSAAGDCEEESPSTNIHHQGRLIVGFLRHPLERIVSLFHYLGIAHWEKDYDPTLALISIEMYARSPHAESNWLVRTLTNTTQKGQARRAINHDDNNNHQRLSFMDDDNDDDVGQKELELAKAILKEKAIIGLLEEKEESISRIEMYLGLQEQKQKQQHDNDVDDDDPIIQASKVKQKECRDRVLLHWSPSSLWPNHQEDAQQFSHYYHYPKVEKDSAVWDLLMKKNALDMELYEYARDVLFPEQGKLFDKKDRRSNP